jgi:hypothetical protein
MKTARTSKMTIVGMSMEIMFAFFSDGICKGTFEAALFKCFQQI